MPPHTAVSAPAIDSPRQSGDNRAMEPSSPAARPPLADDMLRELSRGRRAALEVVDRPPPPSVKSPKVRYTHEAMVDMILENPWISQNALAAYFGYSPAWISTILTSDAFQAQLDARRAELVDPELRLSLQERFKALTAQSLRILQEKLARPSSEVPDQLALRAAELGAKALGIGGNAPQGAVVITSEERLAGLAHRLIALRGAPQGQVIDV